MNFKTAARKITAQLGRYAAASTLALATTGCTNSFQMVIPGSNGPRIYTYTTSTQIGSSSSDDTPPPAEDSGEFSSDVEPAYNPRIIVAEPIYAPDLRYPDAVFYNNYGVISTYPIGWGPLGWGTVLAPIKCQGWGPFGVCYTQPKSWEVEFGGGQFWNNDPWRGGHRPGKGGRDWNRDGVRNPGRGPGRNPGRGRGDWNRGGGGGRINRGQPGAAAPRMRPPAPQRPHQQVRPNPGNRAIPRPKR